MDLERLATSAVVDSISKTDTLSAFINDGDREPVWDGYIYIYQDKKKKKEGVKRIPVQIKGKRCDNHDNDIIKYSIKIDYLKDYADDGGVLLFVVYIDSCGIRKTIYYSALPKVKLINILENAQGNKTVSVECRKFPDDTDEKLTIIVNLYNHIKRQTSFSSQQLFTLEELESQNLIESISFSFTKFGKKPYDYHSLMLDNDYNYMYAKLKDIDTVVPVKDMSIDSYLMETTTTDISVNGVVYYKSIDIIHSKRGISFNIGGSVHIVISHKSDGMSIRFAQTNILEKALVDLPFLIAMIRYKSMKMGKYFIDFNLCDNFPSEKEIVELQKNLDYCICVSELFDFLHLDKDYDLTQMTKLDKFNTIQLYSALIEGKVVSGYEANLPMRMQINYIKRSIALIFQEQDTKGTYIITDFFKDNNFHAYRTIDGVKYTISKFLILSIDDILNLANIDFKAIVQSFEILDEDTPCLFDDANTMLLALLSAYDKSRDMRKDILECADNLSSWILQQPKFQSYWIISILNHLQIEKRKHELKDEQIVQLTEIAEDNNQLYIYRVAANLLLDNHSSAKYYFKKLEDTEKTQIRNFPIYRFWK